MAKSAPHVYLSALPFAPTGSIVFAHYSSSFPGMLRVECGRLSHWPSSELVISDVGARVNSIALSPDGQRIVSCSYDETIRVWNATTGETEAGPFTGHTDWVTSVGFSPDGQRIVSGSNDRTIRVWNATTGETEAGPFTGHTDSVTSVAFSPDGQRIASSGDASIRMLTATTRNIESIRHVDFNDHSVINDEGWICGSNGELLMWIPRIHRAGLHRPSNIWVAAAYQTRIDLSTFVHGHSWATCVNT